MKKVFSILAVAGLMIAGNLAQAQTTSFNAGYMQQTLTTTRNGNSVTVEPNIKNGFFVGGNYNYSLQKGLGLSVGLDLQYFTKSDTTAGNVAGAVGASWENHYNELALSAPIFLNYSLPLGSSLKLKLYAGPVIGYTFFSKYSYKWNVNILGISNSGDGEVDYLSDDRGDNALSPFSVAVAGGVGLDFNQYGINLGYSYGLTDRYNSNDNVKSTYTRIFVGLSYNL